MAQCVLNVPSLLPEARVILSQGKACKSLARCPGSNAAARNSLRKEDSGLRQLTSHHDQHEGGCMKLEQLHALLARHLRPHQLVALYERRRGSNPPAQACSVHKYLSCTAEWLVRAMPGACSQREGHALHRSYAPGSEELCVLCQHMPRFLLTVLPASHSRRA